jgi:hypothetical protein
MKQDNEKYCTECGEIINIKAEICPKCGVRQYAVTTPSIESELKSRDNRWLTCLLLCLFLGGFGVHRFYTGHTVIGVIQLLTLGGCGVWALVDLVIILTGNFKDIQGNTIKNV